MRLTHRMTMGSSEGMEIHGDIGTSSGMCQAEKSKQQLLPGLPDDLTVDLICAKLPWSAFHTLSSVSSQWLDAIRSKRVHNSRVRSNSTETFVVFQENYADESCGFLYSMRECRCYILPGIPHRNGPVYEYEGHFKISALDGTLYCLRESFLRKINDRGDKYGSQEWSFDCFDLAGLQQWQPCEGLEVKKALDLGIACWVQNGSTFCYGHEIGDFNADSEYNLYNPAEDRWLSRATTRRCNYYIPALGGELFAYEGVCKRDCCDMDLPEVPCPLEIFNPEKDDWRKVQPFGRKKGPERLFVARGNFYLIDSSGIHSLDGSFEENVWTEIHSFSLQEVDEYAEMDHRSPVLEIDGELLIDVRFGYGDEGLVAWVLQSKGFGSKTKELVWQKVDCPLSLGDAMCTIQL